MKRDKNRMLVVASTDNTIARGVDLSHLSEMLCYGANPSGKNASQLFARLFDVGSKNEAKINLCGLPLRFRTSGSDVSAAVGMQFFSTFRLLNKIKFIDEVMTGKLVNLANVHGASPVTFTEVGRQLAASLSASTSEQREFARR